MKYYCKYEKNISDLKYYFKSDNNYNKPTPHFCWHKTQSRAMLQSGSGFKKKYEKNSN